MSGCEVAKAGPGGTRRTPCEKDETAENCGRCPFWRGARGSGTNGKRGGVESPYQSHQWRRIARDNGIITNGE